MSVSDRVYPAEAARRAGVTRSTMCRRIERNRIPRGDDGLYSYAELCSHGSPYPRPNSAPASDPQTAAPVIDFSNAKEELVWIKKEREKLALSKDRGDLIPTQDALAAIAETDALLWIRVDVGMRDAMVASGVPDPDAAADAALAFLESARSGAADDIQSRISDAPAVVAAAE